MLRLVLLIGLTLLAAPDSFGQPNGNRPAGVANAPENAPIRLQLVARADPKLHKDCVARWILVERGWLVDGFNSSGVKDPKGDEATLQLLERFARLYGGDPSVDRAKLYSDGMTHLRGCMDPLFRCVVHSLGRELGSRLDPGLTTMDLNQARERNYPPARLALISLANAAAQQRGQTPEAAAGAYAVAIELLEKACAKPDMGADEQRYLGQKILGRIESGLPNDVARSLAEKLTANKDVPEWLRLMASATWHVREGWRLRGSGFVGDVTPEGWRGFQQHVGRAADKLIAAHTLAPDRPEAAAMMIKIAMAGEDPQNHTERYWFDQAVKAQLDFQAAYDNYLWSLRPRWGGSREQMFAFGMECAEVDRNDTYIGTFLLHALRDICEDADDYQHVWEEEGVYEKCKATLDRLAASTFYVSSADAHRTTLAAVAFRTRHWSDARAALDALKNGPVLQPLLDLCLTVADVERGVYPRTTAAVRELVLKADAFVETGSLDEAIASIDTASAVAMLDERTSQGLAEMRERLTVKAGLCRGDWFPLTFKKDFVGWRRFGEHGYQADGENSVICPVGEDLIVLCEPVGRRWELQGTIGLKPHRVAGPLGFLFGFTEGESMNWLSALVGTKAQVAMVGANGEATKTAPLPESYKPMSPQTEERYELDLIAFDGDIIFKVNGTIMFTGAAPTEPDWIPGHRLGLVCTKQVGSSFAFRDLRVRRLIERPAEFRAAKKTADRAAP